MAPVSCANGWEFWPVFIFWCSALVVWILTEVGYRLQTPAAPSGCPSQLTCQVTSEKSGKSQKRFRKLRCNASHQSNDSIFFDEKNLIWMLDGGCRDGTHQSCRLEMHGLDCWSFTWFQQNLKQHHCVNENHCECNV